MQSNGLEVGTTPTLLGPAVDPGNAYAAWLRQGSDARFFVTGEVSGPEDDQRLEVVVFDREVGQLRRFDARRAPGELILPIILPAAVAGSIVDELHPPAPPTEAERRQLAQLDEPDETPEELEEERRRIRIAETGCVLRLPPDHWTSDCVYPAYEPRIDLREEFPSFCRVERRQGRGDLRPVCRRGPWFGYVQPRTWTVAAATVLAGGATGLAFGLRSAGWSHGGVRWAGYEVGAPLTAWGATSAAATGVLLGTTIALLVSDRRRARRFIRREKKLLHLR